EKFSFFLKGLKKPYVTAIIGGSTKTTQFTDDMAKEFGIKINEIAKNTGGSLLILNSRRTGDKQTKIIKQQITAPNIFYDFSRPDASPVFNAFLGYADMIAITGESISMLTEATFANKPMFVYDNEELLAPKHKRFVKILYDLGAAKSMAGDLKNFKSQKIENPGKYVASVIKKNMKAK
ncbi:MAG: mitochondrial fission ELM1 family protein, partial [Rickettsiales bacterium]|nr:mitochondrial fission ELM1 family protein [Rickettsiales bacterium]